MPRGKTYWMVATSLENFRVTRDLGFTIEGMKFRERRKALRIEPGDRIVYYVTGVQRFGATATVTSKCFEDHELLWKSDGKIDDYPWRVNLKLDSLPDEERSLDAREIGPRMEYVKRWPPERWHLAFHGNLHILPKNDFELLENEMKRATSEKAAATL
jgi:hypothetical protein